MTADRFYIGLACTLHDPAIAIVDADGRTVFAEALERPLQEKRAWNHPPDAMSQVHRLVAEHCGEHPDLVVGTNWSRRIVRRLSAVPVLDWPLFRPWLGRAARSQLKQHDYELLPLRGYNTMLNILNHSLGQAGLNLQWRGLVPANRKLEGFDHHMTHAVTAAVASDVDEAVIAVIDGFGEGTSNAFFHYRDGTVKRMQQTGTRRRASLGMFYAMLCHLCGFDPTAGEEWKVMGLAPYGKRDGTLRELLSPLLKVEDLELVKGVSDSEYRNRFEQLQAKIRSSDSSPMEAADLARTGHEIFCERMSELLHNLHARGVSDNLLLAGGCALNSAWNGHILAETPFSSLGVPSAPADDGCAIGVAHLLRLRHQPGSRLPKESCGFALGTVPRKDAMERLLKYGLPAGIGISRGEVAEKTARLIAGGCIVGWMQGRAEFGPRALGQRSILADPRDPGIKERLNSEVKFRESFRPFAPAILHEHGDEWFEDYCCAPHMERTFRFLDQHHDKLPGVCHVDGTGRAQSVMREVSPQYHEMIRHFHQLTGVPIVLNTSLNRMGKPIVHAVEDALGLFLTCGMDALVIEDLLLTKDNDRTRCLDSG